MMWNFLKGVGLVFVLVLAVCGDGCKGPGGNNLEFIESVFPTDESWDDAFPVAAKDPNCSAKKTKSLSRTNFLSAVTHFPAFCGSDSEETNKQELAAFLANVSLETTGAAEGKTDGGLCHDSEVPCTYPVCNADKQIGPVTCCNYCNVDPPYDTYPACPYGYFGRGALQITNPKNYEEASHALYELDPTAIENKDFLVKDPQRILEKDYAWLASLQFWMNHVGGFEDSATSVKGQMTCHQAMVLHNDFGKTVEIINGNLECCRKPKPEFEKKTQGRIAYYKHYAEDLFTIPVTPTEYVQCKGGAPTPPETTRCGLKDNWQDANENCRPCCATSEDCPAEYPSCFFGLANPTKFGETCVCETSDASFLPAEYGNSTWELP